MSLKLYICVLSERHIDDQIELFPTEVLAMERGRQWLAHYAPNRIVAWDHDPKDKTWLHRGYVPEADDGPSARIVEVLLDLGLLSDHESATLIKVMAGKRKLCDDCDGTGMSKYEPGKPCSSCAGGGSLPQTCLT